MRNRPIHLAPVLVAPLLCLVAMLCPAQEVTVPRNEPLQRASQLKRQEMMRYMDLQIDDLRRSCQLSAAQVTRLQTAAKGTVESAIETWIKSVEEEGWLDMMNQVEEDVADQWLASVTGPTSHRGLTRQEVWTQALESILTASQQERRKQVESERAMFRQQAALNQAVAIMETELLLSGAQRDQMRALIDQELGKRFARSGKSLRSASSYVPLLPEDKLKEILNEKQLARWNDIVTQASSNGETGLAH